MAGAGQPASDYTQQVRSLPGHRAAAVLSLASSVLPPDRGAVCGTVLTAPRPRLCAWLCAAGPVLPAARL